MLNQKISRKSIFLHRSILGAMVFSLLFVGSISNNVFVAHAAAGYAISQTGSPVVSGTTVIVNGVASANPYVGSDHTQQYLSIDWGEDGNSVMNCPKDPNGTLYFTSFDDSNQAKTFEATWSESHTYPAASSTATYHVFARVHHSQCKGAESSDAGGTVEIVVVVPPPPTATSTLIVIKQVVNDNGGTKNPSDFTMHVTGGGTPASFPGNASGTSVIFTSTSSYSVSEDVVLGYSGSLSADCSGTISPGQTKTCTVTNDDVAPSLILNKIVINNDGGTATSSDWTLLASGTTPFSGPGPTVSSAATFSAGTYTLTESGPFGYSPSAWVCSGTGSQNGNQVTLAVGQSETCTITNNDIAVLPTDADLSVTKAVDDSTPDAGQTITYTVTVTNNGPATSTNVTVTDLLPSGLTFVSATASQGSYVSSTGIWNVGTLGDNATATLSIAAMVTGSAGQEIVNAASAVADQPDPNSQNSGGSQTVTVNTPPAPTDADLSISKVVDNATPDQGQTITYTVTLQNNGPATSTNVEAHDLLPAGLTFVSATATQGTYDNTTGVWTVGALGNGETATLTVAATVNAETAGEVITNTATASSDQNDPNSENSSNGVSVTVNSNGGGGGNTPPTITLNGGTTITLTVGDSFSDPGATANDAEDGDLTGSIVSTSTVNTGVAGTYTVTYSVTDSDGETVSATRTVNVNNPPSSSGGGGGSSGGGGGGSVLTTSTASVAASPVSAGSATQGEVLGAEVSCGSYISSYIKYGAKNNTEDVKKLQQLLNEEFSEANLPISGFYGNLTREFVNRFQVKYGVDVLAPWVPYGLANAQTPTGYVYKTTKRKINMLKCPALNLPIPPLP